MRRAERVARRGYDEVASFADRHKITHYMRMRHRDWPARLDLSLEFWHDRTVRGQHVAEPHRDHARRRSAAVGAVGAVAVSIQGLTIHFRKPLGRTEHRDRVDRLIG